MVAGSDVLTAEQVPLDAEYTGESAEGVAIYLLPKVRVCVCVRACMCVRACVRVCVVWWGECLCVSVCLCV